MFVKLIALLILTRHLNREGNNKSVITPEGGISSKKEMNDFIRATEKWPH